MKKIVFKLSTALLSALLTNPVHATARPFFYSAEKNGKTIHLLGTHHEEVSLEELPCHNEIARKLNTSDLLFSEVTPSILTLLKYLGNDTEKAFTAKQKEALGRLSEHKKEEVNKIIGSIEKQTTEEIQQQYELVGIRFVDKEKEPFEALTPQIQEILINLISQRISVKKDYDYVDYLYLMVSSTMLDYFFSRYLDSSLDFQMANTAQSGDIRIRPLDNNKSVLGYSSGVAFSNQRRDETAIEEIEIGSEFMNRISINLINAQPLPEASSSKTVYLSGSEEGVRQMLNSDYVSKEQIDILLKNRNELWFQKIIEAFESLEYANIFVAGGLAHFIGLFNVLDMLEAEGFTIQRLSCSSADPSDIGFGP